MWAWGVRMLIELQRGVLPAEQGPDGPDLELQPRRHDRPARRETSTSTCASRARCSSSAPRSSSRARRPTRRCWPSTTRPTRCSTATAASRSSRGSCTSRDKFVGGLRLTADRTGDCRMFTAGARREGGGAGRLLPLRQDDRAASPPRAPDHRRRDRARAGDGGRLCLRARALRADPAAGGRHPAADLSDQGLLDHPAGHRRRGGAAVDADGRDAQGGDHPARRPHPGRRPGRDHRLQRASSAARDRHGALRGGRPVPEGRRPRAGRGLDRPAPDDAGRDAGDRADPLLATCSSTPGTARWAGRWPAARAGPWPTRCWARRRRSRSTG